MKPTIHFLLAIALISFCFNSFALSTDRDQPADIESDEVDVDFKTGKRTFIGNVRFVQGTLRVKADRIDALFKDGKLTTATAYGAPAAFRQRPDGKKNDVEGKGKTIIMNQVKNTLTLKKTASLKQGFDTAKGNEIFYNMATDKLTIKGNSRASSSTQAAKKSAAPKTQTDPFFTEKTKPETSSKPTSKSVTTKSNSAESSASAMPVDPNDTKLPEELILPGQSKAKTDKKDNGRSRLIILPKSK